MNHIYKEITPLEAIKLLAENEGPIYGLYFRDNDSEVWQKNDLIGASFVHVSYRMNFETDHRLFKHCARRIESPVTPEIRDAIRLLFPDAKFAAWDQNGNFNIYDNHPIQSRFDYSWDSDYGKWSRVKTLDKKCPGKWNEVIINLDEI